MSQTLPPELRLFARCAALEPGGSVAPGDALNNIISDGIPDGALAFVLDNRTLYEWRAGSTSAQSLPNVLAPADGRPGRWWLLTNASQTLSDDVAVSATDTTPGNLSQKVAAGDGIETEILNPAGDEQLQVSLRRDTDQVAWFIDPQNTSGTASDSNDGATSATALLTWEEMLRRWGPNPLLTVATTVTLLSDMPDEMVTLDCRIQAGDPAAVLTVQGTTTVLDTFTTSSVQNQDPTPQPATIQGDGGTFNFGAYIRNRLRKTSNGSIAWVGAGQGGTTEVLTNTPAVLSAPTSAAQLDPWSNGEEVEIQALTLVAGFDINVRVAGQTTQFGTTNWTPVVIRDLGLASSNGAALCLFRSPSFVAVYDQSLLGDSVGVAPLFYGCNFAAGPNIQMAGNGSARFASCQFAGASLLCGGRYQFEDCHWNGFFGGGESVAWRAVDCSLIFTNRNAFGETQALFKNCAVRIDDCGSFLDSGDFNFRVDPDSDMIIESGDGLYGYNNSINAPDSFLNVAGRVWYNPGTLNNVTTGGASDAIVGGAAIALPGGLPVVTAANNAMIVLEP